MRKHGLIQALPLSFFSQSLYQDVARNWKGAAFLYLLFLVALCWLPYLVKIEIGFSEFVERDAAGLVQQVPRISISNGEASTDVETPYFIKDSKTGKPVIIIDFTGHFTSLEGTEAVALLTKKQLIARHSAQETRAYELSPIKQFSVDRAKVERWLRLAARWAAPLLFPFVVLFSYAYRIAQAFVYGLIGLIFAKVSKVPLDFMALVRLAIIAITPVRILDTVVSLLSVHVPRWWLICFLIAMGYLYFGVKANALAQPQGGFPGPQSGLV